MLIDILLLSSSEVIVSPNGQSVKTAQLGNSSDACVYTRGSVRRASGFVQTGNTDVIHVAGTWNFLQIWFLGLTKNQHIRGPVDVAVEK